ncbi:MAG: DUF2855 family protein [Caldimonas sp.]
MTTTLIVERSDLRKTRWLERPAPPLGDGTVRMRIDRFALTSNNVTYAAFGDAMHYWDFFPTGEAGTGCVPVWGFADVHESRCAGVEAGERFYGYWPMADQAVLEPARVDASGFIDAAAHRRELPGIYNHYLRCSADPLYRPQDEALIAVLRPLYTTSFLIDDFLADNGWFGAHDVLVSSASSKTAYGLGYCLSQRSGERPKTIGLTSPGNLAFTRGLGCYDEVVPYGALDRLPADRRALYVDMSGDAALRSAVHHRWQDGLAYSCSVGGTHWQALGGGKGLPGPRPTLFFAPAQAKKRATEWGGAELQRRIAASWHGFLTTVSSAQAPWLTVVAGEGREAVTSTWAALLDGTVPPAEGRVLAVRASR